MLPSLCAQIAQLVEQRTENPRVTGSIPVLGILPSESEKRVDKPFARWYYITRSQDNFIDSQHAGVVQW